MFSKVKEYDSSCEEKKKKGLELVAQTQNGALDRIARRMNNVYGLRIVPNIAKPLNFGMKDYSYLIKAK